MNAVLSKLEGPNADSLARWALSARGVNWQVEAVHELLLWDDIVRGDFSRPMAERLFKAAVAYVDFIATGTVFRYIVAQPTLRDLLSVPLLQLALFAGTAWLSEAWRHACSGSRGAGAIIVDVPAGLLVFIVLMTWPGRRWRVQHLLDDWIFAREYLYGRRPRYRSTARSSLPRRSVARVRDGTMDEIVIVGHSLGAMLALDVLDRALAIDPDLGHRGVAICVLTIGATIPKFALHPLAMRHPRASIARIVREPAIAWAEYQSRDDTISFYKFDPVSLRR